MITRHDEQGLGRITRSIRRRLQMHRSVSFVSLLLFMMAACGTPSVSVQQENASPTGREKPTLENTSTLAPKVTEAPTETSIPTDTPAPALTETPVPVASLRGTVTDSQLSCRYGPGPRYLFLYAFKKGANIKLIGRTDAGNWQWVWVDGSNKCWVDTGSLSIEGNWKLLPVVYPGDATLPTSPYYPATSIISTVRTGNSVTVEWAPVPLRAGDEEDENMQHYILETWHCKDDNLVFEPLATNETSLSMEDEKGCALPSHARLFIQEKHGFSGPTDVPWPLWE
jgi:hypothetical protein